MLAKEIDGAGGYFVSDDGRVLYPNGRWTKGRPDGKGYLRVEIKYESGVKTVKVHKLVAGAFCLKLPEHTEVNHKNSNKGDNRATNLEWCTHQENMDHYYREGNVVVNRGESHPRAKLCREDVLVIREMLELGSTSKEIATQYPVTPQLIDRIRRGIAWRSV